MIFDIKSGNNKNDKKFDVPKDKLANSVQVTKKE